jgi:hypothetical protein
MRHELERNPVHREQVIELRSERDISTPFEMTNPSFRVKLSTQKNA